MANGQLSETKTTGVIRREAPVVDLEEQTLLASARSGDSAAFEKLVIPLRRRILRLAQQILRSREDAEDVVQIALLQAFSHLNGFQGQARFSSWLIRITINTALMRLRISRRKAETSLDQLVDEDGSPIHFEVVETRLNPEQAYLAQERRAILAAALTRLGSRNRTVLDLRHLQDLSPRETAKALGLPMPIVKSRLYRARLKLIQSAHSILCRRGKELQVKRRSKADVTTRLPKLQASEV
jgi:RNA polymerase sigma-70 factor, ECF subfamily